MSRATGSYQFENLESRHIEASFLSERTKLRLDGFGNLVTRHGLRLRDKVLEVGTAQGIRARLIAERFPQCQVVGIDRNSELLVEARELNIPNLHFQEADVYDLPFEDASFDFVYARLVFMHLTDPMRALRSIFRVLRKGGRVLIEDADRDCMFFEPAPQSFRAFWEKVQAGQARLGGDPNVGRRLAPYMKEIGFCDLNIEAQPIVGSGTDIEFLARTLMPSLNCYLRTEDRGEGERAIQDLYELAKDPRATFYHFWFAVSGEKR